MMYPSGSGKEVLDREISPEELDIEVSQKSEPHWHALTSRVGTGSPNSFTTSKMKFVDA
jgi:hypothetical protein